MVGVLDKEKGIMELHKADIFHMTPYIKGILSLMQVFLIKLFTKNKLNVLYHTKKF